MQQSDPTKSSGANKGLHLLIFLTSRRQLCQACVQVQLADKGKEQLSFSNLKGLILTQFYLQKIFSPIKKILPTPISNAVRSTLTAFLTPIFFSTRSGHFKSSFKMKAVGRNGQPIPWYTYPCINFLSHQSFSGRTILEFGGGQSTHWWSKTAEQVVSFEGDKKWYEQIKKNISDNVRLYLVSNENSSDCIHDVNAILGSIAPKTFDIIIIDGLFRKEAVQIALKHMTKDGAIIFDNADSYEFLESFSQSDLKRVDFYGYAPGVVLPHCTSIFFGSDCFLFSNSNPIAVIATE